MSKFVVNSTNGIYIYEMHKSSGNESKTTDLTFDKTRGVCLTDVKKIKCVKMSHDGSLLLYSINEKCFVYSVKESKLLHEFQMYNLEIGGISMNNNYLLLWENFRVSEKFESMKNIKFYNINNGELIYEGVNKQRVNEEISWTDDERFLGLIIDKRLKFFRLPSMDKHVSKCGEPVKQFSMTRFKNKYRFVIYSTNTSNKTDYVKIFNMSEDGYIESQPICSKFFNNTTGVEFYWNCTGTGLLVICKQTAKKSYYDTRILFFLNCDGKAYQIPVGQCVDVHDVDWHPKGHQFSILHGKFPDVNAVSYDLKANEISKFTVAPRNTVKYNPQGNLLALVGLKSINSGSVEIWDNKETKLISKVGDRDSTNFIWQPDGEHFITLTQSPELRQNNHFTIWYYTGLKMKIVQFNKTNEELYGVRFPKIIDKNVYREDFEIRQDGIIIKNDKRVYTPSMGNIDLKSIQNQVKPKKSNQKTSKDNNDKKPVDKKLIFFGNLTASKVEPETESSKLVIKSSFIDMYRKKLKNVRKKIKQTNILISAKNQGAILTPQQLEKVDNLNSFLKQEEELKTSIEEFF